VFTERKIRIFTQYLDGPRVKNLDSAVKLG
jgi:hypothetical protein